MNANDEMRELYRELILDHARSPRHFGKPASATHTAVGINPLCGDKLKIYFTVSDARTITDAMFEGSGCAISVASASLLTDRVNGMTTDGANDVAETIIGTLTGASVDDAADLGKLQALLGVREYPSRVKCATLAWRAMQSALAGAAVPATTE